MKTKLALLLALTLVSCQTDNSPTSEASTTTSWAPRLSYANGATVPKVDRIRLVITLADGRGTVMEREADWSQGKVVIDGIPAGVNFSAVVKGELLDGSVVWSGSSEVGSGSGEVAIASQVTVASPLEIQLALDEADLLAPGSGKFPRVSVKNWPYADTGIHILYTTDKTVPMVSTMGTSTMEYAGPFTLQGSGTLNIRAVKAGTNSAMVSSSVLSYAFSGVNSSTCNVPGFQPQPGRIYANGEVKIALDGMSACALRYRTDGQDPTAADPLWSYGSVWLSGGTTNLKIRAFSTSAGVSAQSPVAEGSWSCRGCTQPVVSIQPSGSTDVTVDAGMSLGLGVSVTGASGSDVLWSIDSGMGLGSVTGNGTSAQVYGMAGMSGTMLVRAALAGSGKFVVFRVVVKGSASSSSLAASGPTQLSVPAGGTVQLGTIVTGGDPSMVSWMIESGNQLLVFESGSAGASVTMRAGTTASGTATVRASLNGQSVYFNLTIGGSSTTSGTITASGPTSLSMPAGGSLQLSTMVLNADVSQVSWSVESGATYVYLPAAASGSVIQLQAHALAGSGVLGMAKVRASLPNGNSVLFDVTINGSASSGTIEAVGGTMLSLDAGKTLQLTANVAGVDPMTVNWMVESGMAYATLESISGATAQLKAYALTGNGPIGTATVRASLPGGASVLYSVTVNGMAPDTNFTVSGDSLLTLGAGSYTWLYTSLTGGNTSDIVWSVDGNSGSIVLTPGGSSASLSASTILANGRTMDTVRVRARLGTSSRELTWRVVISGGEPLSFRTSGAAYYSLQAAGSLQLSTMVTGKRNPTVTWTVLGGGSVAGGTPSTSCTYTAPASVLEETDVQVKGTLDGTDLSVIFYVTVSVRPKLEIVDTTGIAKQIYAPERRTAKLFQARRGTGAVAATWEVLGAPAAATWVLNPDGDGYRFKGSSVGDYLLVAREGGDADTVTVRWPPLPSIAFGPDSVQSAETGDYVYMFPKVFPTDEALTWSIGGDGLGSISPSSSMYNPATATYVNGANYMTPSTVSGDSSVMEVTASMTSVVGKSLTYRVVVYPRGLTIRDGTGHADTVFTVADTANPLELSAWRKGKRSTGPNWYLASQPPENGGVIGSQANGVLSFKPAVPGTYLLRAYSSLDGMYIPDVRVEWGAANP